MEESTAPSDDQDQCMVCLNACMPDSEHVWTCGCCHKRCHLLCIFQWTLRISLNRTSRTVTSFSCPGCRTDHAISGLPGFAQQQSGGVRTTTANVRRRVVSATVVEDLGEDTGEDLGDTEDDEEDEEDDETYEDDSADHDDFLDEDEDEEEDEEEDDFGDRCFSSVSTKDIYIEIGQLTINITR